MEMNSHHTYEAGMIKIVSLLNISEICPVPFHCMGVRIRKAFKFRLELTSEQNQRFRQFAGASRVAHNYALDRKKTDYLFFLGGDLDDNAARAW